MKTLIATVASLTVLCFGCGTIAGHDDQGTMGGVAHGVYRGVRTDWKWIAHSEPEVRLGVQFLAAAGSPDAWEKYAQVLLSANEFAFID